MTIYETGHCVWLQSLDVLQVNQAALGHAVAVEAVEYIYVLGCRDYYNNGLFIIHCMPFFYQCLDIISNELEK